MSFSLSKTSRHRVKTQMSPSPRKKTGLNEHKLLNQDKLKVFIKLKPMENNKNCLIKCISDNQLQIETAVCKKVYEFDYLFNHKTSNREVFQIGCKSIIGEVMNSIENNKKNNNGLIFVYGNTGTGKTHTMGLLQNLNKTSTGIVPDSFCQIFNTIQHSSKQIQICVSFCEIYRDQIYDLLDFQMDRKLTIRQDKKSKEPYIQDLIMIQVNSLEQAHQVVNIGLQKRKIAQQKINKRSSRGHGIITIYFKTSMSETAKISFVDLAGCERIKQSESKGATLNEAVHINSSLSALQTLLMNIGDKNIRSYRSNKLTRILQPYFQFGKINLFVTSNYESTQSIQFAKRCKGIKFMERQIKKQNNFKNNFSIKQAQILQQKYKRNLQNIKKQFQVKQKNFIFCIANLTSIISQLYEHINQKVSNQSVFSSFSFPQIFKQIQAQSKINNKINTLEKYQEKIIQNSEETSQHSKISRTSTNMSQSLSEDIFVASQKPNQLIKSMQQISLKIVEKISNLSDLVEYKNIYKKQLFTSQMKNSLLQDKNFKFEKAIQYLLSTTNHDKKIINKLAQFGIILQKQQKSDKSLKQSTLRTKKQQIIKQSMKQSISSNISHTQNSCGLKISQRNGKHMQKNHNFESFSCENESMNADPKRDFIYIDQ